MIKIIYNEGLGFTERTKEYQTLDNAIKTEGDKITESHIYKNDVRIF